ncbi:putative bifunctional diguanylate cyclase/phosphodiesterase [Erythrobacter sp. W53]|uniref:putative bifunctional diguanylate cyclase/phosphodiesterase n=1 Tax=Erythrobacter sp. W53 TaxID=3425947 RepID=UPI003D76778B
MQEETNSTPIGAIPSIRETLGLDGLGVGDWARINGVRYARLKERAVARLVFNLSCLMLAVVMLHPVAPMWGIALWAALVTGLAADSFRLDRELGDADQRNLKVGEFRHHGANSALKGLAWAAPILILIPAGEHAQIDQFSALVFLLMLLASISRFSAPIASVLFCMFLSLTMAAGYALHESYLLAGLTTFIGVAATLGAIEGARTDLAAQHAQSGMIEKSAVVSLLLREYEDSGADWLFELDTNRRLRSVSPRLAYALGRDAENIEGKGFLQLVSGDDWDRGSFPPSLRELASKIRNRENFSNMTVQVEINGAQRWWELSGTPMLDEEGKYTGFRGVGSDVTAQHESSEKIAYLARYDTLTSLPNRLMLHEALADALSQSGQSRSQCCFMMIDLDRFKEVNDSLGHLVGDQLLAQVAGRLSSLMSENAICGRLGGDEFGVVIKDAGRKADISEIANAIISRLSEPYRVEGHTLYVGASVGSALGPRDGETVEELMRNADLALYQSKDLGGGEHCEYQPKLHASAEERRTLEASLRHALANEEFLLNYQPVVDSQGEHIVSFEALIRWMSKEHGFVSPDRFIPLAEETRLIVPIGKWVMQRACEEATTWPRHIKVNVNVSPEQLLEPDFVQTVVQSLTSSGLEPRRLEIEVTESIFLRDANVAANALEQVMALGCSVALDDFGTGYSSLGYLRQLRFSTIKVDRTFVQGASQNSSESLAIIRAVVAMAQSMEMTTTAEGVETAEEAALIRELGCDKIQGYYFGRPMPDEDVAKMLRPQQPEANRLRA